MKANTVIVCTLVVFAILMQESIASQRGCMDRAAACRNIQPYRCYEFNIQSACCATCEVYRSGKPERCPYGDWDRTFKHGDYWYTCSEYVRDVGRTRCRNADFSLLCCKSCGS